MLRRKLNRGTILAVGWLATTFCWVPGSVAQEPQAPKESPAKESAPEAKPAQPSTQLPTADPKKTSASEMQDYRIGEQDVLNITVWKEPQLSGTVTVRPDGKISLPLVDEVVAVGLTPLELQNVLVEKFKPFLTLPQVSVSAREINSRKVYVMGQVGHEGPFRINSNTTVLEILAEAGGLKDYASRKKIYVMRTLKGKQVRYPFNYDAVIRGEHNEQNLILQPGDIIVVP